VKRTDRKSHCPVNFALETVGDPWSLLVVRDIVFHGKHAFGEFLASEERITTSVLADRLAALVRTGILTKRRSETDRRKESYSLTEKGRALIPVLVELANWGAGSASSSKRRHLPGRPLPPGYRISSPEPPPTVQALLQP